MDNLPPRPLFQSSGASGLTASPLFILLDTALSGTPVPPLKSMPYALAAATRASGVRGPSASPKHRLLGIVSGIRDFSCDMSSLLPFLWKILRRHVYGGFLQRAKAVYSELVKLTLQMNFGGGVYPTEAEGTGNHSDL
jgi:hypothetical protein